MRTQEALVSEAQRARTIAGPGEPAAQHARVSPPRTWHDAWHHVDAALRHPWYAAVVRLQSAFVRAAFRFFDARDFTPVLMPVTCSAVSSPSAPSSDSLPVSVSLHGQSVYLADSMQFHLEFLLRHGTPGVFYIMPTFRGEDPDPSHLNEFFHAEAEIRGDLRAVIALVTACVRACTEEILIRCSDDVLACAGTSAHLTALLDQGTDFREVTVDEALALLGADPGFTVPVDGGGMRITRTGERRLMERLGSPLWLTHPDRRTVPFYQGWAADGVHATCADLLLGIGEVVGCGERHPDAGSTVRSLEAQAIPPSSYAAYIQMKRDHPMNTSGFGLGIERYLLWVLQHDDIRDLQVFPRLKGGARAW